jgi:hypothetical protein
MTKLEAAALEAAEDCKGLAATHLIAQDKFKQGCKWLAAELRREQYWSHSSETYVVDVSDIEAILGEWER